MVGNVSAASKDRGRPILVTGAHRSGSTWVGKMLALAPGIGYIHEPFNPLTPAGMTSAPFDAFFVSVTPENQARYEPGLVRTLRFDYAYGAELRSLRARHALRSPRALAESVHDAASFAYKRATRKR